MTVMIVDLPILPNRVEVLIGQYGLEKGVAVVDAGIQKADSHVFVTVETAPPKELLYQLLLVLVFQFDIERRHFPGGSKFRNVIRAFDQLFQLGPVRSDQLHRPLGESKDAISKLEAGRLRQRFKTGDDLVSITAEPYLDPL
jgi:hypothetical protein